MDTAFKFPSNKRLLIHNHELTYDLANKYKNSVDLIVSHQVLEHVVDLRAIFEMFDIMLKPGGAMFHKVDLSDHLYHGTSSILKKFGFSDSSQVSMYLRYSNSVFKHLNSKKCYMNRKLLPFYIALIENHYWHYTLEDLQYFEGQIHNDVLSEIVEPDPSFVKTISFGVFIRKENKYS